MALLLAIGLAGGAQAATWTITPELKRLDTGDTELPAGLADVARDQSLRVGLYVRASSDGASSTMVGPIGFESLLGAIHFESDDLAGSDIAAILRGLGNGAGWERRMTGATFSADQDGRLGPPRQGMEERSWIFFWDDATNGDDAARGAWCTPVGGSCSIFLGILTIPLAGVPGDAEGELSLGVGGLSSPQDPVRARTMFAQAQAGVAAGNSISYSICAQAGCPASVSFEAEAFELGEGEALEVTVTLDEALDSELVVPIRVAQASTAAESLYSLSQTSLTLAAGETSGSLTVRAVENEEDEEVEVATLVLEFGDLPNTSRGGAVQSTRISILDNDHPEVELSYGAADYTAREGGAAAEVSVALSAPPEREITIPISIELEQGAGEGDFAGVPESITFGSDETVQTFEVSAVEESERDLGESLQLGFGELPTGVTLGSQATTRVALRDNDTDEITLSLSESSVAEAAGGLQLRVTASLVLSSSDVLSQAVTLPLTFGGTAVSGDDYSLPGQAPSIVIPANSATGATAQATLSITLVDDETVEAKETLSIGSSVPGFNVAPVELDITDSDRASLSVTGPEGTVEEGSEASFLVRLSHPVDVPVSVDWALADGSALVAEDVSSGTTSGTLTFAAGSEAGATHSVAVLVLDDEFSEAEETFGLNLVLVRAAGLEDARVGIDMDAAGAEARIAAGDPLTLSLSGPPLGIEGVTATYTLFLEGGLPSTEVVATLGVGEESTASADDYSGLPGSITIPAGESSESFRVTFQKDSVQEDEESLLLTLTGARGGGGEVSIDSEYGKLRIGILERWFVFFPRGEVRVEEGGTMEIDVAVSRPVKGSDISVSYALEPRSASLDDFSDATHGRVRIAAGQTRGQIRVLAVDDRLSERPELFVVRLTGVEIGGPEAPSVMLSPDERDTVAQATIAVSDPLSVSIEGPRELKEGNQATYLLNINGGESTEDVSVTPLIALASEADLSDVSGLGARLTIPAGKASTSFTLVAHTDEADEGEERLIVEFSDLQGGGGGGLAIATDTTSPEVLITDAHLEARAEAMRYALSGIGRALGDNLVEMLGERGAALEGGSEGNHLTLGGRALDLDALGLDGGGGDLAGWMGAAMNVLGMNMDSPDGLVSEVARATGVARGEVGLDLLPDLGELLSDSAFSYGLGGEDGEPAPWTLWGSGHLTRFEGRPADHFRLRGEVMGGHLGLDYRVSETLLAGLALSQSSSDVEYGSRGSRATQGRLRLRLTSAHPHMHWSPSEELGLWGSAGYGVGDAVLSDDKGEAQTSVSMRMAAVGAQRELRPLAGFQVSFKADAYLVRMRAGEQVGLLGVEADASRLRLAVAGSRSMEFRGGSLVTSNLELGARADGGHAAQGAGAELRAGLAYAHPAGFNLEAGGHMLLAHEERGFRQWGASLNMGFDGGVRGQGVQFLLVPSWGVPAMGSEGIWTAGRATDALMVDSFDQGMALETRFAYGLDLSRRRGLLTLFTELGRSAGMASSLRVGGELGGLRTRHSEINFEFYGERLGPQLGREPEYGLVFKIRGGF